MTPFYGDDRDNDVLPEEKGWDETAECHHGVSFCDPCEDCEEEDAL